MSIKKSVQTTKESLDKGKGDNDGDEDMLQAALAESQRRLEINQSGQSGTTEVLYNDGATPLFTAIEETKWTDALDLLEVVPEQAKIWVASTGTENTTFGWSLWRRLPIHEACRRQAPAWLVAGLLKAFPSSVMATTQFGELPLHLAVEMGAAPEVVNLLLVNYFPGIHVQDNSGRTPMQINLEADFFHIEDHKYVYESLKNAHHTLDDMDRQWQQKLDQQAAQHEEHVRQLQEDHAVAMQGEKETQRNLHKELARVEGQVQQYQEERKALERTLSSHHVEKGAWREILETKEETVEDLIHKIQDKEKHMTSLKATLNAKSNECVSLSKRVEMLEGDLRNITLLQQDEVAASMRRLEDDFQRIMKSQAILGGKLHGQSRGLALLLEERGILLPPPPPPPPPPPVLETNLHQDDTAMEAVSAAAARAARAAITQAEVEVYEKDVLSEMELEILQQESTLEHATMSREKL